MEGSLELRVKHKPGASPGTWRDSTIKLKLKAERSVVRKVHEAILKALNKED